MPGPTGSAQGNAVKPASDASCGTSRQEKGIHLLYPLLTNSYLVVLTISTSSSIYMQKRRLL